MANPPQPLGLKRSFGFGDRLGLATPGHLAAARQHDFAPVFAQQSIREMERTGRAAPEVISAASDALSRLGYAGAWGADADHLKTPEHVDRTAAAGFCFFTIDPSEHIDGGALTEELKSFYLGRKFEVPEIGTIEFDRVSLGAAAVKYGRALGHCAEMGRHIAGVMDDRPFEIEISIDETEVATSVDEHFFIASELKRLGTPNVVSIAPRFVGDFEKGVDYRGDILRFNAELVKHTAIARHCGPHKISVHSGSDKFSIYPILGHVCGDLLHVKTAGTSYLEALRAVARTDPRLFGKIVEFCRDRFDTDRRTYHISTSSRQVASLPRFSGAQEEGVFLDENPGRQLLHVTYGSVLTNPELEPRIRELLVRHADLHEELLAGHLVRHLKLLNQG